MPEITIAGRRIGPGHPPYVIAEMSGNHNGDIKRAFALLEAAKKAGADAVKLQTYTADTITIDHNGPGFRIEGGLWDGRTLYELYQEAHTPWDWHPQLFAKARELGIAIFSSPFDSTAIEFLEELEAPAFKIASFEIVDLPLIQRAAKTGKPLIISTGMASIAELDETVRAARAAGCKDLVLLKCTSTYPASPQNSNLRTIPHLRELFGCEVGLSDHSMGVGVSVAAVALGASVVEKHFTLDRSAGGVDASFSLEPAELASLVIETERAWQAMGQVRYGVTEAEGKSLVYRRSLYVTRDMAVGEAFNGDNVRAIRPGLGLAPKHIDAVLGRHARQALKRGTPLDWAFVQ